MVFSLKRRKTSDDNAAGEADGALAKRPEAACGIGLAALNNILALAECASCTLSQTSPAPELHAAWAAWQTASLDTTHPLITQWVWLCRRPIHRGVVQGDEDGSGLQSEVFVVGAALCAALHALPDAAWACVSPLPEALGSYASLILVHGDSTAAYTWQETCDTIAALQLEVPRMIYAQPGAEHAYACDADVMVACLYLMERVGFYLTHHFPDAPLVESGDTSIEHMEETVGVPPQPGAETGGKMVAVRAGSVYLQIAALHGILSLLFATTQARSVATTGSDKMTDSPTPTSKPGTHPSGIELFSHHREASLDVFYEISMLADLAPGFVMQYRSRYAHLFHSISQVVYFHYPQYSRRKQIPLSEITAHAGSHISTLPLILQLFPAAPVLYEHTGGCCLHEHARYEWSWLMLSGFVLLVHRSGAIYGAEDLRTLAALLATPSPPARGSPA